ncbi:MAG: phytanoyl-CoA dioxygenase family protein, partial [Planctomycetes bacterium]|nr:phytanoyl-CoA dioxygenase family protein [Planctomycetota bacterium]
MSVAHRLPDACVADFQRDGFLPSLPVLPADEVAELRRRVDHIREELAELEPRLYEVEAAWSSRPDQNVCHFLGGWQVDPVLHDLVFDPRVTVPAAQLLGVSRLRFWHDQVFFKPPHHPGVVPWHQDYSYWT